MKKIMAIVLIIIVTILSTVISPASATAMEEDGGMSQVADEKAVHVADDSTAEDDGEITMQASDEEAQQDTAGDTVHVAGVSTLQFKDEETGILAEIDYETLDNDKFDLLRDYYNNRSLSEQTLFERYISLKKSYITAMESLYNTNYLGSTKKNSETAMKMYYEGKETLFGLDADVYLYNVAVYENGSHSEQTYLDIIVPVHSTMSVLTVHFTIPLNQLETTAATTIASIISEIKFKGLSPQYEAPSVLSNSSVINRVKLGIYPAADQKNPPYFRYSDNIAGYTISIPEYYVQFVQNSLGGVFTYTSFKINPYITFSVFSEPSNSSDESDAISRFKVTSLNSVEIIDSGEAFFGNNKFHYVYYTVIEDGIKKYTYDYYIAEAERLYKLQLQSSITEPGDNVKNQMNKILTSFSATQSAYYGYNSGELSPKPAMLKYINPEEGYSFEYPENWRLEDVSEDIAYDRLKLSVPGFSGTIDITFQESGIRSHVKFIDIIKSVDGTSVSSWPYLTIGYDPPFKGKTSKLLCSDFKIDGSISIIYRLSAYIDEYGRNRLCYSVDILKGSKIYSMFITAGEYSTKDGRFADSRINELVNIVASSFRVENTPESEARRIAGETRNRKIVFVENYLKRLIDSKLKITAVGKKQADGTFIATVENTVDSGYYKIRLDYNGKQVEVLDRVLISSILQAELSRLKELYKNKNITKTAINEQNMLITIEFTDNITPTSMKHIYLVKVSTDYGHVSWETRRIANREDYIFECGLFAKSLIGSESEVYIFGDKVFSDLDTYWRKGLMYPVMVFTRSEDHEKTGFMILSMNPATSTFLPVSNFITLERLADDIARKQLPDYVGKYSKSYTFDPKSFTLEIAFSGINGKVAAVEHFKIYYHQEEGEIKYEKVNTQQPDKHQ